ncbi:AtpZ/AtpI family protein [uncultured Lutibacter sp.]|uniref:AtpZ/AtpI family protein n=1 Tax=uncultured Lutibacter sp. TaxID=437739 RepID=UPI00260F0EDA|nr:AtpZ/AtpI family protein [uncultured Lutibacter sp.]
MEKPQKKKQLNKYIYFSSMAFQMGIVIAIGTVFGQWLDGKYENDYSLFTIIFSLLAVFGSLYLMIKKAISISK